MAARLALKSLSEVCRRTATSHAAGLDARTIWQREAESGNATKRGKFRRVSDAINRGSSLSEALRTTDDYLPELVYDMVYIGEQTGRVDEVLNRLAQYYDQVLKTRSAFLAGIAWPMIQFVFAVLLIGFVIWIMGVIQSMMGDSGMEIDMLGLGLTGTSGAIKYFAFVGAVTLALFFFVRSLARGTLSAYIMGPLMKLPAVGKWLQFMAMSRMAWALGMSVDSGMAANKCAEVALRSTQNNYFMQHQQTVDASIRRGETFYEAFSRTEAFSQDFLDSVQVGEETGRLGEAMATLSQQYEQQGKVVMQSVAVVGGVMIWGMVAAFIIYFIFQIAFFYFGLLDDVINGNF